MIIKFKEFKKKNFKINISKFFTLLNKLRRLKLNSLY
jgi:hypothetical protein